MAAAQPFLKAELFIASRQKFTELLNKAVLKSLDITGSYTLKIFAC